MKNLIHYKNYYGSVSYSDEDQVFFGKIENIKGLVNYEGTDVISVKQAFHEAVDDYLELCQSEDIIPNITQNFGQYSRRDESCISGMCALS